MDVFMGRGGVVVGRDGERNGRSGGGGVDWAPPLLVFSRLDERVTRGKRVGTERGALAEDGLFRPPPLLELFFVTIQTKIREIRFRTL